MKSGAARRAAQAAAARRAERAAAARKAAKAAAARKEAKATATRKTADATAARGTADATAARGTAGAAVSPPPQVPTAAGTAPTPTVPLVRRVARSVRSNRRTRSVVLAGLILVLLAALGLGRGYYAAPVAVRVVAAGDMACDPDDPQFLAWSDAEGDHCRQLDVSTIAVGLEPDLLLGLGDYQHELPTADAYRDVYGPSWGRLRPVTVPIFGNQEYKVRDANTFTAYFGDRIRDPRGYWSQDVGDWHLVVLNSNCGTVAGGCAVDSPQQRWLAADLARTDRRCVLAAWHHPRWSSGITGPDERTRDLFQTLYDHGVELVLSGHEAQYERFGPLDPAGQDDPGGVRQFVVGTGGQAHYHPSAGQPRERSGPEHPASEFTDYDHHGVLDLELRQDRWRWRYHALDAGVVDEGTARCA